MLVSGSHVSSGCHGLFSLAEPLGQVGHDIRHDRDRRGALAISIGSILSTVSACGVVDQKYSRRSTSSDMWECGLRTLGPMSAPPPFGTIAAPMPVRSVAIAGPSAAPCRCR